MKMIPTIFFFYLEGIAIAYVYNYADTKLESPWKS